MENLNTLESTLRNAIVFFQDQAQKARVSQANPNLALFSDRGSNLQPLIWNKAAEELQLRYVSLINRFLIENKLGVAPSLDAILAKGGATETIETQPIVKTETVVNTVADKVVDVKKTDTAVLKEVVAEIKQPTGAYRTLKQVLADNHVAKNEFVALSEKKDKEAIIALYNKYMGEEAHSKNKDSRKEVKDVIAEMSLVKRDLEKAHVEKEISDLLEKNLVSFSSGITKNISGSDLVANAHKYTIDGKFNVMVLTGVEDEKDVAARDLINLQAKQLLASGQEGMAVQFIQTQYAELGFDKEKARTFLHKLVREDNFSELRNAVKAILIHGDVTKEDYRKMLHHANSLVKLHSRSETGSVKDSNGVEAPLYKTWSDKKITNFVDSCVNELIKDGYLSDNHMDVKPAGLLVETSTVTTSVVDAETSLAEKIEEFGEEVATTKEEIANIVSPKPLSKREQKAAKFKADREAKKTLSQSTVVEEQPVKEDTSVVPVNIPASSTGPSLEEVYAELKQSYAENGCITRKMQLRLANCNIVWQNPLYPPVIGKDKDGNPTKEGIKQLNSFYTRISYTLRGAGIDPNDFEMIKGTNGEDNQRVRIVNNVLHTLNVQNEWVDPYGKVVDFTETQPIALAETTEPKKETVSASEEAHTATTQSDVSTDTEKLPQTSSSNTPIVLSEEGTKVIEHPATTASKEKGSIYARIEKTAKGFMAYLEDFKFIKINNAATVEEAQEMLAKATVTYIDKAEEVNDKVESDKKGKKMTLPKWLTRKAELIFNVSEKQMASAV